MLFFPSNKLFFCFHPLSFLFLLGAPDLIALLQSGGLLRPTAQGLPPNLSQLQGQHLIKQKTNSDDFQQQFSNNPHPLPALPNSAISVEDLERNLVPEPTPHVQPQQALIPPPGFASVQESPPAALDPLKALEMQMLQNQSLMRGQLEPLLGRPTNPIWPQTTVGFPNPLAGTYTWRSCLFFKHCDFTTFF